MRIKVSLAPLVHSVDLMMADGVMDLEEFVSAGGSKKEFVRMDKNNDGVLDLDEIMMAADYAALDFDQYDYKTS